MGLDVPRIVAVTGLSGTGKTTAADYLSQRTNGRIVYLGQVILDEVARRGLSTGRDSEDVVRRELRAEHGPAALVMANADALRAGLGDSATLLVDAVMHVAELEQLQNVVRPVPVVLIALAASFETRCLRLSRRPTRPFDRDQLRRRDEHERHDLYIEDVFRRVNFTVDNEGSSDDLRRKLDRIMEAVRFACVCVGR